MIWSKMNNTSAIKHIVCCILSCVLFIILFGCTNSLKPKTTSLRGRVVLEGSDDHQGVSVYLYQADIVEEQLRVMNKQYPNVGFTLKDLHLFDHRGYTPIYSVISTSDGRFEINGVERDKYILVLLKEGFGPRYIYDLYLDAEIVEANQGDDIEMYELIETPQYVDGSFVFESGKSYITYNDVVFRPGSNVVFESGSTLLINPGSRITIYGSASFEGSSHNPSIISSSDRYYLPSITAGRFSMLELSEVSNVEQIHGIILNLSNEGLVVNTSGTEIFECIFYKNNISCNLNTGSNSSVLHSFFLNSSESLDEGLLMYDVSDIVVNNSAFVGIGQTALSVCAGRGVLVTNCYFLDGINHILNSYDSQMVVSNSTFVNAEYNLTNTAQSTLDIQNCDIKGRVCIYTMPTPGHGNLVSNGWTKANCNNFDAEQYTVLAKALFNTDQYEYVPLDFKNNFWGTTDQASIEQSIFDFNDIYLDPIPGNIWPLIEFVPFRTSRVVNAGVQ